MPQRINTAGLLLIKRFEECRLQAYLPTTNDVPTIAWGHTRGVKMGDTCTQVQADTWLAEDVAEAERIVSGHVFVDLNPNQFSALVSLAMNIGLGGYGIKDGFARLKNGRPSTLLTRLNESDFDGAAAEFHRWNHQGGTELTGLTRRRQAEEELFRRALKPLKNSKTIKAGALALPGGAIGLVTQFDDVRDALYTLTPYWKWAAVGIALITILSAGYMVWRRIHDNLTAAR